MKYVDRKLIVELARAARGFAAVLVTGPRQCGKTTLLRHAFPKATYVLLEDPDTIARVRADPRTFLDALKLPVIIDEIQNAPELFGYIRSRIDAAPTRKGQWLLTGSQEAPLMQGVSESMAGRIAILQMLPLSVQESAKVSLLRGGYPGVIERPGSADLWFRSYLQTYLERDVRIVTAIKDLGVFRRFIALLATRSGSMLNKTDLAAPLGVSVPTITQWLDVLEITGQILIVPPFFENFGKRLIKTPKIYFTDSGLACHLLGIDSATALLKSVFLGPMFETFVAAEIVKQQINSARRKQLYYFRDHQGLEVDFVVPNGAGRLALIEAKASKSPTPAMAASLLRLAGSVKKYQTTAMLVHAGTASTHAGRALAKQVTAVTLPELLGELAQR